jgi:hypothetical protein
MLQHYAQYRMSACSPAPASTDDLAIASRPPPDTDAYADDALFHPPLTSCRMNPEPYISLPRTFPVLHLTPINNALLYTELTTYLTF